MNPPDLLTPAEAAKALRKTSKGLWQLVDAGKLRAVEFPGHKRGWRFTPADIAACIEACRSGSAVPDGSPMSKSERDELDAMLQPKRKLRKRKRESAPSSAPNVVTLRPAP